jgi:VanZ family protein
MRALRRWVYWLPAAAWMVTIFVGSTGLLSDSRTSRFLAPLLRWLVPGIAEETVSRIVFAVRKCAHAGEYGLLAVLVLAALGGTFRLLPRAWSGRRAGWALLICAGYAVSDEVHQAFVPSRFGNPVDVLIDTAGAAAALLMLRAWCGWRARRRTGPAGRARPGERVSSVGVREPAPRP